MENSSSLASFDFNLPKGAHTVRLFAIKGDFMPRNRRSKKNQVKSREAHGEQSYRALTRTETSLLGRFAT